MRWRWLITTAVLALLILAARRIDWHHAIGVIGTASLGSLAVAIAFNGASLVMRGARWWIFLRRVGAISFNLAVRGAIVGSGFNSLLVANGGDAARVLLVARAAAVSNVSVLATLALDRIFDPLCFGLLLFVATYVVPLPSYMASARVVVGVLLLVATALLLGLTRPAAHPRSRAEVHGWRAQLRAFRESVACLATRGRFGAALLCSIGVWLLQLGEYAFVARAVHLDLPFAGSVAAMLLINFGLVLRATPGGVGYFQFAYALAVSRFGVATEAAVATALLIQMVEIIPVALLAVVLTPSMARKRHVPFHREALPSVAVT
jgi:glycosyltransferase 2 family protein